MTGRRLLPPEEAATLLAVSRSKVYELMRSGRLSASKSDGSRRVPLEDFIGRAKEELRWRRPPMAPVA